MLRVVATTQYRKDYKKLSKNKRYNLAKLDSVIDMLASGEILPAEYKDHQLKGDKAKFRECHIAPDWVLIYEIVKDYLILSLVRTGSHSELLSK